MGLKMSMEKMEYLVVGFDIEDLELEGEYIKGFEFKILGSILTTTPTAIKI